MILHPPPGEHYGTASRPRHHALSGPFLQGATDPTDQAPAPPTSSARAAPVAPGPATDDARAVVHRRRTEPLGAASERHDPPLPKDPRRARCLRAGLRAAVGRRSVRELPGGLCAPILGAGLRLGRRSALEGAPARRELVG